MRHDHLVRTLLGLLYCFAGTIASADDSVTAPTVFLDKSPRIVAYQLQRLSDERLLLVPRSTDDAKYIPVYEAILKRPAMSPNYREEAVDALVKLRGSSPAAEILSAIEAAKPEDEKSKRSIEMLTRMLLDRPPSELAGIADALVTASQSRGTKLSTIGFAGLLAAGRSDQARSNAGEQTDQRIALLHAIELLPDDKLKTAQRDFAVACFEAGEPAELKAASMEALSKIPSAVQDTFDRLIPLVIAGKDVDTQSTGLRITAARGLLRLPQTVYRTQPSRDAALALVEFAEATRPADRTSPEFIDAMQLVDRLMRELPADTARGYRERLREITVRVVKIQTVEEEMRYDTPYFAVEAGRPVQILLENHDLMPHNLVVTQPGALKAVALGGLAAGPEGTGGLPYVPDSPNVLAASEMVAPDSTTRITLDAPEQPGEYPYVCTFPQHWYRMYGVMVVVEDLEAWNRSPTVPANPIGSNRSFAQAWKLDDFADALPTDPQGRSPRIGEKIFNEASCVGCHKIKGVGGAVGPELTEVYKKWKGDDTAILREILQPSHTIDPKYAMQLILTVEGNTLSGIVIAEDDDKVTLVTNPDSKEPIVVPQDDIEEMVRSTTSMMPKGLMDQFTKDEVLELLAYLQSMSQP
ncbi:c-type cytochrome [Roseiconus nitratireducens]|uniref:C-type cytochrome n=1 Tax=Roseiconus nitratireducens TaxID=2605748 RepID=A0A5M6DAX8_9BACT|nr:c-type cytochrome [Roseiconus nitratireducens]KAA5543179.1 c-type cytochrome [Roseiconus nitratireducens]